VLDVDLKTRTILVCVFVALTVEAVSLIPKVFKAAAVLAAGDPAATADVSIVTIFVAA